MKKRLVIYDFDGTLFKSPDREQGEAAYFEATGEFLPFAGWWGREESLLPPVVPEKPTQDWYIEQTINAYNEDVKDEDSRLVLMTGRPYKRRRRVKEICDHFGLRFHDYYFRGQPGSKGSNTFEIKTNFIVQDLLHNNLEILEIWEDRPEHTSAFFDFAKKLKKKHRHIQKIVIHDVLTNLHNAI